MRPAPCCNVISHTPLKSARPPGRTHADVKTRQKMKRRIDSNATLQFPRKPAFLPNRLGVPLVPPMGIWHGRCEEKSGRWGSQNRVSARRFWAGCLPRTGDFEDPSPAGAIPSRGLAGKQTHDSRPIDWDRRLATVAIPLTQRASPFSLGQGPACQYRPVRLAQIASLRRARRLGPPRQAGTRGGSPA